MTRIVYLDQNAWVTLAKGSWDKERYPMEHKALAQIVNSVSSGAIVIPLTFANIYETMKINVPARRINMALTQSLISAGRVFRSRRRILSETLKDYLAERAEIVRPIPPSNWFLSDLFFDSGAEYSEEMYGFKISDAVIKFIRQDPGHALFDYLVNIDEKVRQEAVRRYSVGSAELIDRIESRRSIVAGNPLALRKRAYSAQLIIDELDFIFAIAQGLGLAWSTPNDIGSSLTRSIAADVPVLNIERELAVRLEDQGRTVSENDLRDMMSFVTVFPFADTIVAEKQFVNLSRQARLDERYETKMLTSIFDLQRDEHEA